MLRYRQRPLIQPTERPTGVPKCSFDGCGRLAPVDELCFRHRRQRDRKGSLSSLPVTRPPGASQLRDEQGRKQCGKCLGWLETAEFHRSPVYPDGLAPYCKDCGRLETYKVTPEWYRGQLSSQGGGCAVCGKVNASGRALAVDHDRSCCRGSRSCGRCVRGLLCARCLSGLGMASDDVVALRSAVDYLTSWKAAPPRDVPAPPVKPVGRRWSKYRVSDDEYERRQAEQGGACAVCARVPRGVRKSLAIDHDHSCCPEKRSCGRCVRGLLCQHCNSALGLLGDDVASLEAAIRYLEKYRT
ncbi:endonuclease domain-containing protein [Streptomyces scopuliridis]|uniref:endonuclease domain-containing protein n=1 Tax=Streptomyces scopuliridis TaxID=452529 RepID=UPI00398CACF0